MNELFLAFAAAFTVPLLFHSWRIAIFGLCVQGILLSMVPAVHSHEWNSQVAFECVMLFAFRGILAPWLLYFKAPLDYKGPGFSLIGKNLFQWASAVILMTIGFILGNTLAPDDANESLQVGTAAGCILIGMLILSNQTNRLGQVVGLLTIESGMALVELLSPHAMPFSVSIGVNIVYVALLFTLCIYLKNAPTSSLGVAEIVDKEFGEQELTASAVPVRV
jgi:hydrogenase-4 membrane subunit HyfE